jgi:hypothetical protein
LLSSVRTMITWNKRNKQQQNTYKLNASNNQHAKNIKHHCKISRPTAACKNSIFSLYEFLTSQSDLETVVTHGNVYAVT